MNKAETILRTPLSTRLSGSAKEAELRIRNIFQWKKKRPPLWAMVLTALVILSCGSLVSCQVRDTGEEPPAGPSPAKYHRFHRGGSSGSVSSSGTRGYRSYGAPSATKAMQP